MKRICLLTILFFVTILSASAFTQTGAPGQEQPAPQGMKPGCRMMGGSGMGMGPGMMMGGMGKGMMADGMGMGRGMMMGGMQGCMMGGCGHGGMGCMDGMGECPGPQKVIRAAFQEIDSYQMHAGALELSKEQVQRLSAIKDALSSTAIKSRADLQIAAIEFRQAMDQDLPDVKKTETVIDRQGGTWQTLQKTAVNAVAEARRVLTPEQRQKAEKLASMCGPMMMPMAPEEEQPAGGHESHH